MKKKNKPQRNNPKEILLRYSRQLKYNDGCNGQALEFYKSQLEAIADHAEEFEKLGFKILIDCKPEKYGRVIVYLVRNGAKSKLYSKLFDTFDGQYFQDLSDFGLRQRMQEIIAMGKMFNP